MSETITPQPFDRSAMTNKWQSKREEKKVYQTTESSDKPKYFALDMFPYPSGAGLHVGHPKGYIATDVISRKKHLEGYNVLHPMGFDSFGLPTENYAMKNKIHPSQATDENIATFIGQLKKIGFNYDRDRMVSTADPEFYKRTQRQFLQMYHHYFDHTEQKAKPISELREKLKTQRNINNASSGMQGSVAKGNEGTIDNKEDLITGPFVPQGDSEITNFQNRSQTQTKSDPQFFASLAEEEKIEYYLDTEKRIAYISTAPINRCPSCMTALANEDLDGNNCERCGSTIERKKMRQWMIRITDYAQRLLDGLDLLPDRQDNIKAMQRHWIGKSEGVKYTLKVKDIDMEVQTYSTHFEAFFADRFAVIAPDHSLLPKLTEGLSNQEDILIEAKRIADSKSITDLKDTKDYEGVFTGRYLIDPITECELPLWVASYALADYGTGIVKCSCHDERDFAFAKKYKLPLYAVMFTDDEIENVKIRNFEYCFNDFSKGILAEPQELKGKIVDQVREDAFEYLISRGFAEKTTAYKINNRVFSRQRYWGEPIPFVYKEANSNSQLTIHNSQLICLGSFKGSHLLLNTEKQAELKHHHEYTEDGCVHVVGCIIRDSEGKIYVHHNALKNEFFFPGGKVDTGETVEQASVRELQEELELTIAIEDVKRLSSMKVIHGGVKRCFHMVDILHYEGPIVDHETAKYDHYRAEIIPSDNAFGFAVKVDGTITDDIYDIMHTFVDIYNMNISLPQLDNDGTQGTFETYDISSIDTSASYYQYYDQSQKKYFFSNKYIPTNIAIFGQPQFNINGEKDSSYALLYSKETHRYCIVYNSNGKHGLPGGTVDAGETFEQALHREVQEETGYSNISIKKGPQLIYAFYRVGEKGGESNIERWNKANFFLCELENDANSGQSLTSDEIGMGYKRVNKEELLSIFSQHGDKRDLWNAFMRQGIDSVLDNQEPSNSQLAANHNRIRVTPMDASELPLTLPDVAHYEPTGTEEGPLAKIESWINTTLSDGTPARRESNTMPGWAGSSWYRLRYMDPRNQQTMLSPDKEQYRGQVDLYVGGMEHACRHLIYARFWHKFLKDIGVVSTEEPFKKLVGVGLVLAEDGRKMSKRRGNVINPDDVIAEFGTDAFRTYEMFMGPFGSEVARSTAGVKGVRKFLDKIIKLSSLICHPEFISCTSAVKAGSQDAESSSAGHKDSKEYKKALTLLHKTIKKVTEDIDNFSFNTAISALMIYVNHLEEVFPCRALGNEYSWGEGAEGGRVIPLDLFEPLIQLIAPFAPHLAEELREKLGHTTMLYEAKNWPSYDPTLLVDDVITMGVQFNGKMKGTIEIAPTATQDEALALVQADAKLASNLIGDIKKIIYVPGRILNIVVG